MTEQTTMNFMDITAGRHRGNSESVAANKRASWTKEKQRLRVLEACRREGGVTCRELAAEWGVPMHTISGRFSELKRLRQVRKSGVRDGSGVLVAL